MRIAIGVSIVVLLLASLFIWLAAGRAIAPLQALSRTARTISRDRSLGPDPGPRQRRDRRARPHLQRHARPARDRVRRPEGLPHRRQPRAAHADHRDPRPPRDARRLARRARGGDRRDPGRARPDEPLRRRPAAADQGAAPGLPAPRADRPRPVHARPVRQGAQPRRPRLAPRRHRRRDRRRRPAAPHPGGDEPRRRTRSRHTGDGDAIWLGSSLVGDAGAALGPRRGPGVDPADRERIFARYARAGSAARRAADGAGLGLSIVRAIAEAHGGRVELDSRPGHGLDLHDRAPADAGQP